MQPFVIDPLKIKGVDASVVTHIHSNHLDIHAAAAAHQDCLKALFVGPGEVAKTWQHRSVPAGKTRAIEPGQEMKVNNVNVVALKAFDRTALIASDDLGSTSEGRMSQDMNELAVNYLFEISGGTVYHAGDSHYSSLFMRYDNRYAIDVCLGACGENPRGITDKIISADILRMVESLNIKVVIPVHYDIWSNFMAGSKEIMEIWRFKEDRLHYQFRPYIQQVGSRFAYLDDKDNLEFNFDRGFDDVFVEEDDTPFPSFLQEGPGV